MLLSALLAVAIHVVPTQALVDEPVAVTVVDLKPRQHVIVTAEMDGWVSSAEFCADRKGVVRLSDQPIQGTWKNADPMGFVWSMQSKNPGFPKKPHKTPIEIKALVDGKVAAVATLQRTALKEGIVVTEIKNEDVVGTLYVPPSNKPLPGIVVFSGTSGLIPRPIAELFASRGFIALAAGYFGNDGLPKHLHEISLEQVQKAVHFLKKDPRVGKVGIYGISRGGELVLLCASHFPEDIHAVVSIVPSSVSNGGFPDITRSAWTLKGSPLPVAPVVVPDLRKASTQKAAMATTSAFLGGAQKQGFREAAIPVEQIKAPVLLVAGEDDGLWPSAFYARQVASRLRVPYELYIYPKAGHMLCPCYIPTTCRNDLFPTKGVDVWLSFGGEAAADAHACKDSWGRILNFYRKNLK